MVVQQEPMFVKLLDGGEKGLFSVDCFKSWNDIVYWPRKPGKCLVLLQHISRPPNDMLAYVFPAVSTPAWKGESLLAESWTLVLNDVTRFEAPGKRMEPAHS